MAVGSSIAGSLFDLLKETFTVTSPLDMLHIDGRLLRIIKKMTPKEVAFEGSFTRVPFGSTGNEAIASIGEFGHIPIGGSGNIASMVVGVKKTVISMAITANIIDLSQSNKGAFKNALTYQFEMAKKSFSREEGRVFFGGGNGILCQVNGNSTITTITCDNMYGYPIANGGTNNIRAGMIVGFTLDGVTLIPGSVRTVATVASTGLTFTVTPPLAAGIANNAFVVRMASLNSTSLADDGGSTNERMGLGGMIDNGIVSPTYFGLSRNTFPVLNSFVNASVGALTAESINKAALVCARQSGFVPSYYVMGEDTLRVITAFSVANQRLIGDAVFNPDIGTAIAKGRTVADEKAPLKYAHNDLIVDYLHAPPANLWLVNEEGFRFYTNEEGRWEDRDTRLRLESDSIGRKHEFSAFFYSRGQYMHARPNSCARLSGFTTDYTFVPQF